MPPIEEEPDPSAAPTDSLTTAPPTTPAGAPDAVPARASSSTSTTAPRRWPPPTERATSTPRRGCRSATASELASTQDSRLLRYPGSTLTTVLLNLRPNHPEFRDPKVRTALLEAIDRARLIDAVFASLAVSAPGPIPPSSPLFDPAADPPVAFSTADAKKALKAAGWDQKADGWYLAGAKKPLALEVLSPEQSANPGAYAAAEAVAADWKTLGLAVDPHRAAARDLRERPAGGRPVRGGGHRRDGRPRPRPLPAARVEPDPDRWLEHRRRAGHGPRQGYSPRPANPARTRSTRRRIRRSRSVSARADTCSRWPSPTRPSWSATTSSDRPSDRSPTRLIDFGMC